MASSVPPPPDGYTARPATPKDLPAIDALYLASEQAMGIRPEQRSGYLGWRWSQPYVDVERDTRVVLGPGGVAAFAFAMAEAAAPSIMGSMGRVHPDHVGRGLGAWALTFFEHRAASVDGVTTVRLGIEDPDEAGHTLVRRSGYERVRTNFDMGVRFDGQEQPGTVPQGVSVRDLVPGEERVIWRVVIDAFRDHWDHEEDETYEVFYGDWFEDAEHPPRILVAEVDGEPQGVIAWIIENQIPYVFSVAVRQGFRGRGIATSLLEHAKQVAAADGYEEMTLSVDATNPTGAVRVYERVGMSVIRSLAVYHKPVT